MLDVSTDSLPATRSAVLLTNLLISFRFPFKVVLFGFGIRWMNLHMSFVFFEFKIFLSNDVLVEFSFGLISFLTFLYPTHADLALFECASYLNLFLWFWSAPMSSSFIHGAGGEVFSFSRCTQEWFCVRCQANNLRYRSYTLLRIVVAWNHQCIFGDRNFSCL